MVHTGIKNLKKKPFGGAYSIHDEQTVTAKNDAIKKFISDEKDVKSMSYKCFTIDCE